MNKLLIVHPEDNSTRFLRRISNNLQVYYKESNQCKLFSVKCDDVSHAQCIKTIDELKDRSTVLFLGHGRSDRLHGAKSIYYQNSFISDDFVSNNPEYVYYEERFIHDENIAILKNKYFMSLSCNSTGKLGKMALQAGCLGFIGFGNIPSSNEEIIDFFDDQNLENVNTANTLAAFKGIINRSLIDSMHDYIRLELEFIELRKLIRFRINQHLTHELKNNRRSKEKQLLISLIQEFRNNIASIFPQEI